MKIYFFHPTISSEVIHLALSIFGVVLGLSKESRPLKNLYFNVGEFYFTQPLTIQPTIYSQSEISGSFWYG